MQQRSRQSLARKQLRMITRKKITETFNGKGDILLTVGFLYYVEIDINVFKEGNQIDRNKLLDIISRIEKISGTRILEEEIARRFMSGVPVDLDDFKKYNCVCLNNWFGFRDHKIAQKVSMTFEPNSVLYDLSE